MGCGRMRHVKQISRMTQRKRVAARKRICRGIEHLEFPPRAFRKKKRRYESASPCQSWVNSRNKISTESALDVTERGNQSTAVVERKNRSQRFRPTCLKSRYDTERPQRLRMRLSRISRTKYKEREVHGYVRLAVLAVVTNRWKHRHLRVNGKEIQALTHLFLRMCECAGQKHLRAPRNEVGQSSGRLRISSAHASRAK